MTRSIYSRALLASAAVSLFAWQGEITIPANAQELALEEIVVTARKREESLLEIPLSVQAFSMAQMESEGLRNLEDLSAFTTGLTFENQSSWQPGRYNSHIRFRGMVAPIENPSSQSGTLFIDNVAVLSSAQAIPTADIARVEVIKGPQPVYFGRGTFGGAVNYITADPSDEFGSRLIAEYAEHGSYNFVGTIEGPLVEGKVAARITASFDKKGSMFTATDGGELGEERTDGINATFVLTPTDDFRIKARASFNRVDDGAADSTYISFSDQGNCAGRTFPITSTTGPATGTIFSANWYCGDLPIVPITNNTDLAGHGQLRAVVIDDLLNTFDEIGNIPKPDDFGLRSNIRNFSVQADYDASEALSLSALAGYNENHTGTIRDNDNTDLEFWANLGYQRYWAWTAEARADYDDGGPMRGVVGISRYEQKTFSDIDSGPGVFFVFPPGRGQNIERDRIKTTGIFAGLDFDLNDWLTISGEARYQINQVQNNGGALGAVKSTGQVIKYKKFTPRVILTAQPQDNLTVYASISQGVLPGLRQAFFDNKSPTQLAEIAAQTGDVTTFLPQEVVTNFEAGWKQGWDNGFVSLTAFWMKWKKMKSGTLVLFTDEANPDRPVPLIGSVLIPGDSEIKGVEFEGGYSATDQLTFNATLGFNQAQYKDFPAGNFNAPFSLPGPLGGQSYKADGNQLPKTPKWKGSLTAVYTDELMADWDWYLRGSVTHNGKIFMTEANLTSVPAYTRANFRLGFVREGNFNIELFCTNCFDEDGYRTAARLPDLINLFRGVSGGQGAVVVPIDKREVGLKVGYDF